MNDKPLLSQTGLEHVPFGRMTYGLGIMAIGSLSLDWGEFVNGQPVHGNFPYKPLLAHLVGAALLAGGAGFLWNRTSRWSAAAIAAYYLLVVVILMNGSDWIAQPAVYGEYEGICIQLAIALAALVAWANPAGKDIAFNARLVRGCQIVFGLCALVFGGAHFVYLNMTQPLVPKWLPPSQIFWAYATGLAQMAGGAAIVTGIQGRLAARLLTVMYALFQCLIHLPMLIADPSNHYIWSENATNLALTGAAWIIADTMATKSATLQEPSE